MIPSWQLRQSVHPPTYQVEDSTKERIAVLEHMVNNLNATVTKLTLEMAKVKKDE